MKERHQRSTIFVVLVGVPMLLLLGFAQSITVAIQAFMGWAEKPLNGITKRQRKNY